MNMFQADLAFTAELIAIGVGAAFIIWAYRSEGAGLVLAKIVGYVILILAILTLLCTTYYATNYWAGGYFKTPVGMYQSQQMMQKHPMMMQRMQKMRDQHMKKMQQSRPGARPAQDN